MLRSSLRKRKTQASKRGCCLLSLLLFWFCCCCWCCFCCCHFVVLHVRRACLCFALSLRVRLSIPAHHAPRQYWNFLLSRQTGNSTWFQETSIGRLVGCCNCNASGTCMHCISKKRVNMHGLRPRRRQMPKRLTVDAQRWLGGPIEPIAIGKSNDSCSSKRTCKRTDWSRVESSRS